MVDDVLINKAAIIERCVQRARDEFEKDPGSFSADCSRQDAAILNVLRACEAALSMGQHLIWRERLGVPQSNHDVFALLARAGRIDSALVSPLQNMVEFRKIALHDDQELQLSMIVAVVTCHLGDFTEYSRQMLLSDEGELLVSSLQTLSDTDAIDD
ncbi:DUF86 domain-containing protein [Halopseudomonas aestusnigri]|uniref:type VII toxin-antitoxin system HepT family RNase toxin n=1 Tax=Halopseudomonas aestusnigri TaxID=857252 RepID=UPI001E56970B|nr:DUF86 domain-containing protein [Halopseudomonas aestusnigri]UGV32134.1 DUF86 domain-containing protein [Halopseudomonas aestusnigri]